MTGRQGAAGDRYARQAVLPALPRSLEGGALASSALYAVVRSDPVSCMTCSHRAFVPGGGCAGRGCPAAVSSLPSREAVVPRAPGRVDRRLVSKTTLCQSHSGRTPISCPTGQLPMKHAGQHVA